MLLKFSIEPAFDARHSADADVDLSSTSSSSGMTDESVQDKPCRARGGGG